MKIADAVDALRRMRIASVADGIAPAERSRNLLDTLLAQPDCFDQRRGAMIATIARSWQARGAIIDPYRREQVLHALDAVPRESFVDPAIVDLAYLPTALAIGEEQTISHPQIVAAMTLAACVEPHHRVLEIGTGCGYQAAVISRMARSVLTFEIRPALALAARERLVRMGFDNVEVRVGDGVSAARDEAPFDAILVTAMAEHLPPVLIHRLRTGGRLVMPILQAGQGRLAVFTSTGGDGVQECSLGPARFVPLVTDAYPPSSHHIDTHMAPLCYCEPITPADDPAFPDERAGASR